LGTPTERVTPAPGQESIEFSTGSTRSRRAAVGQTSRRAAVRAIDCVAIRARCSDLVANLDHAILIPGLSRLITGHSRDIPRGSHRHQQRPSRELGIGLVLFESPVERLWPRDHTAASISRAALPSLRPFNRADLIPSVLLRRRRPRNRAAAPSSRPLIRLGRFEPCRARNVSVPERPRAHWCEVVFLDTRGAAASKGFRCRPSGAVAKRRASSSVETATRDRTDRNDVSKVLKETGVGSQS
jgi:hypothetical protein